MSHTPAGTFESCLIGLPSRGKPLDFSLRKATIAPEKRTEKGSKKLTRRKGDATVLVIDQARYRLKTRLGHGRFNRGGRTNVEVSISWEATKLESS